MRASTLPLRVKVKTMTTNELAELAARAVLDANNIEPEYDDESATEQLAWNMADGIPYVQAPAEFAEAIRTL